MSYLQRIIGLFALAVMLNGCSSVMGFQKMYVADEEMILKEKQIEIFEINAESYREGASGANGGKAGGGCGCN